jgi:hypothetical protein
MLFRSCMPLFSDDPTRRKKKTRVGGKVTLTLTPLDPIRTRCAHGRDVHPVMSDVRDLDLANQHL